LDFKKINTSYPEEEFEDTKGAIIICKSKNRQHNGQKKKTEEQTTEWPKEKDRRTNNRMAKRKRQKNRQHNGQKKKTEEQITQWPKEKGQIDKQRSTKHTHKTKYRVTRTPLKTGGELRKGKQFLLH
jgi:hypothetical protein